MARGGSSLAAMSLSHCRRRRGSMRVLPDQEASAESRGRQLLVGLLTGLATGLRRV